jgi:hypothetical protein
MISASPVQEGMRSTRQRIEERARKERQNKKAILKISTVKSSKKLQPILSALHKKGMHSTRQRIEERARKERQNKKAILKISAEKSSEKLQPILSALGTRMQSTI